VHAVNLPPAAGKRVYQLWFIPRTGRPIPSVTFNSEASGRALVQKVSVPANVELTAAALTEEPEGGSTQPTTPVILAGSFEPGKS
jgi:anti-sigma-K factor RskA